jgi:hypothetical protein
LIEFDIEPLWFFRKIMFFSVAMETVEIEKKISTPCPSAQNLDPGMPPF